MPKGKVQEYYSNQGYGSIVDLETGHRLTVYANYVHLPPGGALKEGQEVDYDVESHRNEEWAVNVRVG